MRVFQPDAMLSRAVDLPATDLDDEKVLMSIEAGAYFGLKGPARVIWDLLATPITHSELLDKLVARYEVTPEVCAADLGGFLADMESKGLLRVG